MELNKIRHVLLWVGVSLAVAAAYAFVQKSALPATTFTTINGQKIALNDLRGKIVLVNFWATSCGFCMQEMPELIATYQLYQKRGFEVIAVAMSYDDPIKVSAYATQQKLLFPVVFDNDGVLAREFGQVNATPTTFLIDKSGKRISRTLGTINFRNLHAFLDSQANLN